jgi:hypothetical protein
MANSTPHVSRLFALFGVSLLTAAAQEAILANTWVRLAQDPQGAGRASAIRYAGEGEYGRRP